MIRKLFVGSFPQQKEVGEVSSDGTVYGGQGVHKEPIGLVDADGRVYEKHGTEQIYKGRVDLDGNIYASGPIMEQKVGRVDPDGTVYGNPGGIPLFRGTGFPIGQIRDATTPDSSPRMPGLKSDLLGDWPEVLIGKRMSGTEQKPSRVLPEGAALLLLFHQEK
jgi:hypothetical protein